MRKEYLVQAWLILALALCMGAGLAAVEMSLGPIIEENKRNEMLSQVPALIPGAAEARLDEQLGETYGLPVARALDAEGKTIGWAIQAKGPGYGGDVTVMIGLDDMLQTIKGIYVLEQKETPELGNKIILPSFRGRFENVDATGPVTLVKKGPAGPGQVEGITGATISSTAVVNIVNQGVRNFRKVLFEDQPVERPLESERLDAQEERRPDHAE